MHMSQLMPLPLTVSYFSKIQIGFTFLVPAHLGSPGKRAVKRVCVLNGCVVRDYPGRPLPEETLTHSHPSWSLDILYQLPPFTTIHSILCVQFTCLTVLFDNLSPRPLWSSCWSSALYFILHEFLHPVIIFSSQHMPIPTQPVLL